MDCKGTFSINEIAHFIGIVQYKLFARMREIGILFKNENGDNVPYEKSVHKGILLLFVLLYLTELLICKLDFYADGVSYITKLLR